MAPPIAVSTLRPGYLVVLNSSIKGNVHYTAETLEEEHYDENGQLRSKWATDKTVSDPDEQAAAVKVRSEVLTLVRRPCARSKFGLLCPVNKKPRLDQGIRDAHALVDRYNATAKVTRVSIYIIAGFIAPDDLEALKAIRSEISGLFAKMELGIGQRDVGGIRDAAKSALSVAQMLTPEVQERVKDVVVLARKTATAIKKAGAEAAQEIDRAVIRQISQARTAFLDLDDAQEVQAPTETGRAIDLSPGEEEAEELVSLPGGGYAPVSTPQIEL